MQIYLPIAEISVNIFLILGLGGFAGILSGMFGVGGGFLMTPLLIFIGVSPAVAVATSANQIIASSLSGFLAHWRRQNVDFKMGTFLLAGGVVGSTLGVGLFTLLKSLGHIDLIISVCYVVFLTWVGSLMAYDSLNAYFQWREIKKTNPDAPNWRKGLPWQVYFPRSRLQLSAWLPLGIGCGVGVLVSLMGVGGGFFLIPAMIYILGMPTSVVVGTSLFQIIFITANVTLLQAVTTQTVDILLALLLLSASVFGAQIGTKLAAKLPGDILRSLLAALVLTVSVCLAYGLFAPPQSLYTVTAE